MTFSRFTGELRRVIFLALSIKPADFFILVTGICRAYLQRSSTG